MKLSLDDILAKLRPELRVLKRYVVFLFIIVFLGAYGFLVQRIGHLIQDEPSQAAVESKLKPVSTLKIDEEAIKKITELEAQNIEVKSLFDDARKNPFVDCLPPNHINDSGNCVR